MRASGWRKVRVDNAVTRRIPSRIANWLMAKASGVDLHDFGTTFKAYRAEVLKDINLYGELHRFIPALANSFAKRITEVPVAHAERAAGESKYGLWKLINLQFDLLTSFSLLPIQMLSVLGVVVSALGVGFGVFLFCAWIFINVHHYCMDSVVWRTASTTCLRFASRPVTSSSWATAPSTRTRKSVSPCSCTESSSPLTASTVPTTRRSPASSSPRFHTSR